MRALATLIAAGGVSDSMPKQVTNALAEAAQIIDTMGVRIADLEAKVVRKDSEIGSLLKFRAENDPEWYARDLF